MQNQAKGYAGSVNAQDAELLGVSWYYNWMVSADFLNDPKYVPNIMDGHPDVNLPSNYSGYVLLFGEPDVQGQEISPTVAADLYDTLTKIYPQVTFVVGGVTGSAYQWLIDFRDYCVSNNITLPTHWHIHGYCGAGISVENSISYMQSAYAALGGTFWVTEYNSFDGVVGDAKAVTNWIIQQAWIERVAMYTNRNHAPMSMIDTAGNLTVIGQYYAGL